MILYHVTPSSNIENILKEGLIPKLGGYATEMQETTHSIWMFPSLEDAVEMIPVWLEPFYGSDLAILEITVPDDFPVEYTGSDYEVVSEKPIKPEYIREINQR